MSVPNPNALSHVISLVQQPGSGNNNSNAANNGNNEATVLQYGGNSPAVVAQAEQTLRQCLEKFKRVLPEDKFSRLEMLVKQLQLREITRDEFDKKYFEIMLPYVTPAALPQRYLNAATIYIPPYRLSQEAKKQFLLYFQVTRDQKYDLLKNNPELVQILRQFVVLQRQQQIAITETGDSNVVLMDGEQSVGAKNNNAAAVSNQQQSVLDSRKRKRAEEDSAEALGAPAPKITKNDNISVELNEELAKLREQVKLLQEEKAAWAVEQEKLKSEVVSLQHELQIYKHANVDEMEKMRYDELSTVSDALCFNLNIVNKVLKRKHEEEENDKYGMSCIICYENRKNVIFRPCSHVVQCDCCPVPKECPVCKKKIEMACKIFI